MENEIVTAVDNIDHVLSSGAVTSLINSVNLSNEIGSKILTMLYIFLVIVLAYLLLRLYYKFLSIFL